MDKIQEEVEFSKIYAKSPKQAVSLLYGKVLDIEDKVTGINRLLFILFGLIVVPIVGIIIGAFFRAILKV